VSAVAVSVPAGPRRLRRWAAGLLPALAMLAGCGGTLPAAEAQPVAPVTQSITLAGAAVAVDAYRPATAPRGAVILSHGFTRSRATLGGHAAALASRGIVALTPDLPSTFDFRRNAAGLAELVALLRTGRVTGQPVERVVLVGFSAGALSSLLAASAPGVVGYIGLDPFDRTLPDGAGALGRGFAPGLATPALLLRAPPSRCNAQSVAEPWGRLLPALVADRVVDGASHCDFESPSDWICALACGAPDPARQALVRAAIVEAVERWLAAPGR
jgi:dienelactone hydrolase